MSIKTVLLLFIVTLLSAGCGVNIASESPTTEAPKFVTATLPPSPLPLPTHTSPPPTASAPIVPVEGITTSQVNVRQQTSTASEAWGTLDQFTAIQVIGKDASGSWYRIIYPRDGTGQGWVRAEFVQVDPKAEIAVIGGTTGGGSGVSGLVIQKINVRSGPGTTYDSLGALNPKDVVFITGKDPSGAWMQIEFVNSPDGLGWAALEFLQVDGVDSLPVVGGQPQAVGTSINTEAAPPAVERPAIQDGDSMQAPLATVVFSAAGVRRLQVGGEVSAPDGDLEDWIQVTSSSTTVSMELLCASETVKIERWNGAALENEFPHPCGEKHLIMLTPGNAYFLRLVETSTSELRITQYTLSLEAVP